MKRTLAIFALAALVLTLAACAPAQDRDLLSVAEERGTLIIGTEGTWSPWTYHDTSDKLVGFDIEVAQAVCDKLGLTPEFVEGEWDSLLMGIESGMYDTMANGVNVTPERSEKFTFSAPYAYSRTALMVRADDDRIHSFEDLRGMTTANTISSTYAQVAERYGANVTGVDDLNQTIELLLQGRIDATLNDEVTYIDYISQHPDANIKVVAYTQEADIVAMPFRQGEETAALLEKVNEAIEELRADGTLSRISVKYFGSDLSGAGN